MVNKMVFPSDWVGETEKPTEECKKQTIFFCSCISHRYNLMPSWIAPTREEGIFILYRKDGFDIDVEILNDGYITVGLSDRINKKIIQVNSLSYIEWWTSSTLTTVDELFEKYIELID